MCKKITAVLFDFDGDRTFEVLPAAGLQVTSGFYEVEYVFDYFKGLCEHNRFISIQNKIDINKPIKGVFDCCVSAKTGDGFENPQGTITAKPT